MYTIQLDTKFEFKIIIQKVFPILPDALLSTQLDQKESITKLQLLQRNKSAIAAGEIFVHSFLLPITFIL
jgi:hypothetical protein